MKILVINSGLSSVKFQLLNMNTHELLCNGLVEKIGINDSIFTSIQQSQNQWIYVLLIIL